MAERVLAAAGLTSRDIERFAVTTGPGSFTGIRVGISFIRALALASGRRAVGIDRFHAFYAALGAAAETPAIVALDSRRGTAFVCDVPPGGPPRIDGAVEREIVALEQHIAAHPEATVLGDVIESGATVDLVALATLAERHDGPSPRPFYLRPPDAVPASV